MFMLLLYVIVTRVRARQLLAGIFFRKKKSFAGPLFFLEQKASENEKEKMKFKFGKRKEKKWCTFLHGWFSKKKIFNKNPPKVHTNHINEIDLKLKKQNKNMKKRWMNEWIDDSSKQKNSPDEWINEWCDMRLFLILKPQKKWINSFRSVI